MPRNGALEEEAGRGQPYLGAYPGSDFWRFFQEKLMEIAKPINCNILSYSPTLVCLDACPLSFKPMKTPLLIMPPAFSRDRQILNSLVYQG